MGGLVQHVDPPGGSLFHVRAEPGTRSVTFDEPPVPVGPLVLAIADFGGLVLYYHPEEPLVPDPGGYAFHKPPGGPLVLVTAELGDGTWRCSTASTSCKFDFT